MREATRWVGEHLLSEVVSMAKKSKGGSGQVEEPKAEEKSQEDRAPYQKNSDRDPVKSVEETRHIPSQGHGAVK
jgi:hypothetical protein